MPESKTEHVPGPAILDSLLRQDTGYYRTTITDDEGNESKGCDRDAEKSHEKASNDYNRNHK